MGFLTHNPLHKKMMGADPDWFFFATGGGICVNQGDCAFIPARTSQSFAWNHGDIQDEIASTWAGIRALFIL